MSLIVLEYAVIKWSKGIYIRVITGCELQEFESHKHFCDCLINDLDLKKNVCLYRVNTIEVNDFVNGQIVDWNCLSCILNGYI